MGASKRVTELLVQAFAHETSMECMTVRFGNVLGSHGSVIPLFEKQIKAGGPVLITHPEITRYFMTIPEAAQLVLQAGTMGKSGSTYVLDMGQPVKIMDLAEKLIRFHGYNPNEDMPIEIIGLRPGEKLYEELLMDEEANKMETTAHGRIFRAHPAKIDIIAFWRDVDTLLLTAQKQGDVRSAMKKLVPNYTYDGQAPSERAAVIEAMIG
jgi:FlaA1/EpsC-like NDP-sugar epimerase